MGIIEAVKKYYHGENKDEKVARFEELNTTINSTRSEIDEMVKGLNVIIADTDIVKKSANTIINSDGVTSDNIAIALDNMRFSDKGLSEYMESFTFSVNKAKTTLEKAEREMVKLISDNPNIATIICDVKHDDNLEKALDTVMTAYKEKDIDRKTVIEAYNSAMKSRRTDRDLQSVLNKHLKDNG